MNIRVMNNVSEKLSVVKRETDESVSTKLQAVLKRNWIFDIYQCPSGT
jgi:hypothetical protein